MNIFFKLIKAFKIDEEKIMSFVMLMSLMITGIVVTIAWFVNFNQVNVSGMTLKVGNDQVIALSLKSGDEFVDIDEVRETGGDDTFALSLLELTNIEDGKMAPGAFGEFTVYVKSLSDMVKEGRVTVSAEIPETNGFVESATEEVKSNVTKLVKGHIKFYYETTVGNADTRSEITADAPLVITFDTVNQEIPVTIYWEWVYEYTELDENLKNQLEVAYQNPEGNMELLRQYFDVSKIGAALSYSYTELYDYGDTLIGNNVNKLQLGIMLEAGFENGN